MVRSIFALILVLAANTAFAEDKKPPSEPASVSLPAAATQADAGKETPAPQPATPTCTLPPLTLPASFTTLIREELVVINRNNTAITAYGEIYKTWSQKKADYDICRLRGGNCKDPGKMPAQPKITTSFLDYLNKPGKEQANGEFYSNVGFWLVCAELTRAVAVETCQNGNAELLTSLEQDLKKACPLVIDRRRR